MKKKRLVHLALGLVLGGVAFAGPAAATLIPCKDISSTKNYMLIDDSQVSACLDAGVGNIQGDNAAQDLFLSGVGSDYEFASKNEGGSGSAPFGLTYNQDGGSGIWGFDASFWDTYSAGAIGFKFGTGNEPDEWFVYSLVDGVFNGNWQFVNVNGKGGGLSHVNLYAIQGDDHKVPEPATLALIGVGLFLMGVAMRRRGMSV